MIVPRNTCGLALTCIFLRNAMHDSCFEFELRHMVMIYDMILFAQNCSQRSILSNYSVQFDRREKHNYGPQKTETEKHTNKQTN